MIANIKLRATCTSGSGKKLVYYPKTSSNINKTLDIHLLVIERQFIVLETTWMTGYFLC
jgi:hypothetical protein